HCGDLGDLEAELARDERRGVAVDELVDGREDAALDELADDVCGADGQELGELLDRDRARQLDRAALLRLDDRDGAGREGAGPARGLPGSASAAGAAPTPGHAFLLDGQYRWLGPATERRRWAFGSGRRPCRP